MAINELFNKLMGRGVLGNVGDAVVSMGKEAQETYSQHSNAVGKNVFGSNPGSAQETLMKQLSGTIPLKDNETKETILEAAQKAGTINVSQKSALDYFMVQNQGKAYTPDSIANTLAARDESVTDKFQTKSATFLETPTSMPGMSKIGEEGLRNDLITLGAGAAVGGIVGSAMYDNAEGGMLTGLVGAGLGRGIARAVNKNLDSISAYGMKTVLGDELVKEGDKIGYSIDDATKAKMKKLGFKTNDLNIDTTTGKVTRAGKEIDLAAEGKAYESKATTELTMEDIGLGAKVADADKSKTVGNFTKTLIKTEEQGVDTAVKNLKANYKTANISKTINAKAKSDINLTSDGYDVQIPQGQKPTKDFFKEEVLKQRQANLNTQKQTLNADTTMSKQDKDQALFQNEMRAQALTNDGKRNASLLEDQAKAAHAAIFKPQKNVAATAEQAQTMNLNNLKSKKESDLGAVQNMAKNMLTNPGGAGKLTGQYRNMILGGAALSGVAFTSNKRDYRRGINANKGNRI